MSNAKQDLRMATMIAPNDRKIMELKEQVERDLPVIICGCCFHRAAPASAEV